MFRFALINDCEALVCAVAIQMQHFHYDYVDFRICFVELSNLIIMIIQIMIMIIKYSVANVWTSEFKYKHCRQESVELRKSQLSSVNMKINSGKWELVARAK